MLKRFLPYCLLTVGCLVGSATLASRMTGAIAQTSANTGDLYYTFYDQRISLIEREDQIAVHLTQTKRAPEI